MFKNWKTTLIGITAGLASLAQPLHDWLVSNQAVHIGPVQILGLIVMLLGIFAHDSKPAT